MPTDALRHFRDALIEAEQFGLEALKQAQIDLGRQVRDLMQRYRYKSVAAEGFEAPSVVVCFAPNAEMKSGKAFAERGASDRRRRTAGMRRAHRLRLVPDRPFRAGQA